VPPGPCSPFTYTIEKSSPIGSETYDFFRGRAPYTCSWASQTGLGRMGEESAETREPVASSTAYSKVLPWGSCSFQQDMLAAQRLRLADRHYSHHDWRCDSRWLWIMAIRDSETLREIDCIEYPLEEHQSLQFLVACHRRHRFFNAFVRISLGLTLEPYFRQKALQNMRSRAYTNVPVISRKVEVPKRQNSGRSFRGIGERRNQEGGNYRFGLIGSPESGVICVSSNGNAKSAAHYEAFCFACECRKKREFSSCRGRRKERAR
jgi:hypothetical protein